MRTTQLSPGRFQMAPVQICDECANKQYGWLVFGLYVAVVNGSNPVSH